MTARDGADENQLSQEFLNKLRTVLIGARDQLLAFSRADSRRIVYVVIKFDNFTGEFDAEYFSQIDAFINANRIPDVEIEFHKREIKNT